MTSGYEYICKVLLVGNTNVGKTSLLLRLADDTFDEQNRSSIGVDFRTRNYQLNGETIKVQMWDTAGQERFRSITRAYYRGATGIILLYDITNRESFEHIREWIRDVNANAPPNACRVLVANKSDLVNSSRAVTEEEGAALGREYGIPFKEISVKDAVNVEELFVSLVTSMRQIASPPTIQRQPPRDYGRGSMICRC